MANKFDDLFPKNLETVSYCKYFIAIPHQVATIAISSQRTAIMKSFIGTAIKHDAGFDPQGDIGVWLPPTAKSEIKVKFY
jgi:hypothetical protein